MERARQTDFCIDADACKSWGEGPAVQVLFFILLPRTIFRVVRRRIKLLKRKHDESLLVTSDWRGRVIDRFWRPIRDVGSGNGILDGFGVRGRSSCAACPIHSPADVRPGKLRFQLSRSLWRPVHMDRRSQPGRQHRLLPMRKPMRHQVLGLPGTLQKRAGESKALTAVDAVANHFSSSPVSANSSGLHAFTANRVSRMKKPH